MRRQWLVLTTLVIVLVVAFGLATRPPFGASAPATTAAATPAVGARSVTVTGQGEVAIKPDLAYATFGVVTTGTDLATAQGENATRMAAVLAKLKGLGIAEKDLQTVGYAVYPQYDKDGKSSGYQVTNSVRATVRDIATLGAMIDAAVAAGANRVAGIAFDLADKAQAIQQARAAAVSDARAKAEQYASLTGVALGGPLTISEGAASAQYDTSRTAIPTAAGGASTPIETGEGSVTVTVQISYEIR